MTSPSHRRIVAYSHGDYLEPTLTTLTIPDPHSTCCSPTPTSTSPVLYLHLQTSLIFVDRLGYFDWSIGARLDRWAVAQGTLRISRLGPPAMGIGAPLPMQTKFVSKLPPLPMRADASGRKNL